MSPAEEKTRGKLKTKYIFWRGVNYSTKQLAFAPKLHTYTIYDYRLTVFRLKKQNRPVDHGMTTQRGHRSTGFMRGHIYHPYKLDYTRPICFTQLAKMSVFNVFKDGSHQSCHMCVCFFVFFQVLTKNTFAVGCTLDPSRPELWMSRSSLARCLAHPSAICGSDINNNIIIITISTIGHHHCHHHHPAVVTGRHHHDTYYCNIFQGGLM